MVKLRSWARRLRRGEGDVEYPIGTRVSLMNGIFGCPHEEGIDYPNGGVCPRCPFWAEHDRFEQVVPSFHD
jgi:hypothetical protein